MLTDFLGSCSLLMCTDSEELKAKAGWSGVAGNSRASLLTRLRGNYYYINIIFLYSILSYDIIMYLTSLFLLVG